MTTFSESMAVFRGELEKGCLIEAYQGLMAYLKELRSHFEKHFPDYEVPGNMYYGYLDMTYFSILPPSLKKRGLKIAVVFLYETFRFEVWLSGRNRQRQVEASRLIQEKVWEVYRLTPEPARADSVLDHVLVEHPDFSDLEGLTRKIESGAVDFIQQVEGFFNQLPD